ncbi:hypothetical protein JTB14_008640 [Gonioctena quinquepunctata]|nr:hypothetical protein JTB14_008640 [Gonioctena quinquepunctata]
MMKNNKLKKPVARNEDLLDQFSPLKVAKVIPISTKENPIVFNTFRPQPGEMLDYNISETFVKMDVGDTKLNVRNTEAFYVPAPSDMKPKPKKKPKYCHGGPPQWKFVDEIWREEQDRKEERSKREFKNFVIKRKRYDREKAKTMHTYIKAMWGPDWYQELSPKQLKTAERFQCCITQDSKDKTMNQTKENIAILGLVPRPNPKKISLALNLCCGSDVEFLLILYQLLDPERQTYSINDKLLLSAVVHLTMSETLRELHVRIPSPPRKIKVVEKSQESIKKNTYKSPYLEPYTFKPEPQKYTGVYENKHIQRPESPYFSYVEALRKEIESTENILTVELNDLDPAEYELIEDMKNAQKSYDSLPHKTSKPSLLRPTVKKICLGFYNYSNKKAGKAFTTSNLPHLAELEDTEEKCTCVLPSKDIDDNDDCCEFEIIEKCDGKVQCCCREKSKLFISSLCKPCIARRHPKTAKNIIVGVNVSENNTVTPIIAGTFVEKECDCLLRYKEKLMAVAARNKIKCQKAKYVMNGVINTGLGPVYAISGVSGKKELNKVREEPERVREVCDKDINPTCICKKNRDIEETENSGYITNVIEDEVHCECKKELDIFLKHKCTCKECPKPDVGIPGLENIDEEAVINFNGEGDEGCDCVNAHLDRLKRLEEYKHRIEARYKIKSQNIKYAIGGVVNTSEGPVYCIEGVRPPVRCICAEVQRELEEREESMRRMAKMPATEPCECEKLYEEYTEAHKTCLNSFEEYSKKVEDEMKQYDGEFGEATYNIDQRFPIHPIEENETETEDETPSEERESSLTFPQPVTCVRVGKEGEACYYENSDEYVMSRGNTEEQLLHDSETTNGFVASPPPLSDTRMRKSLVGKEFSSKRYIILKKIPRLRQDQIVILKKVLASLEEDGFPLAKLPDCYKLPHFRLWMEMRCGRFWKQKDRRICSKG